MLTDQEAVNNYYKNYENEQLCIAGKIQSYQSLPTMFDVPEQYHTATCEGLKGIIDPLGAIQNQDARRMQQ